MLHVYPASYMHMHSKYRTIVSYNYKVEIDCKGSSQFLCLLTQACQPALPALA